MAEYTFDNISGITIYDTSGNNNHTTSANLMYESGPIGSATQGEIDIPEMKLNIPESVYSVFQSMSMFFRWHGNYDIGTSFLSTNVHTNQTDFVLYRNNIYTRANYSDTIIYPDTDIPVNQWTHLVLEQTPAGKLRVHTNTTLRGAQGTHNIRFSYMRNVGRYKDAGSTMPNIDQLRFYSRNLEQYEISNLYNGGRGC